MNHHVPVLFELSIIWDYTYMLSC